MYSDQLCVIMYSDQLCVIMCSDQLCVSMDDILFFLLLCKDKALCLCEQLWTEEESDGEKRKKEEEINVRKQYRKIKEIFQ